MISQIRNNNNNNNNNNNHYNYDHNNYNIKELLLYFIEPYIYNTVYAYLDSMLSER